MTMSVPTPTERGCVAGVAHLAGDIGGRVPAGIGVQHPEQADGEGAPAMSAASACAAARTRRLGLPKAKPAAMNTTISAIFKRGPEVMEKAAGPKPHISGSAAIQ